MKFSDHISDDTKKAMYKKARKRRKKRNKEKLSFKDIESLMGIHRDRYCRGRGGALRKL